MKRSTAMLFKSLATIFAVIIIVLVAILGYRSANKLTLQDQVVATAVVKSEIASHAPQSFNSPPSDWIQRANDRLQKLKVYEVDASSATLLCTVTILRLEGVEFALIQGHFGDQWGYRVSHEGIVEPLDSSAIEKIMTDAEVVQSVSLKAKKL